MYRDRVPTEFKAGQPEKYADKKDAFLEIFREGGSEGTAAKELGLPIYQIANWKRGDKDFERKYRAALDSNLLALYCTLEDIVINGEIKEVGRAAYFNSLIKRRQRYLSRTSISLDKKTLSEHIQNIRERLANNDLTYDAAKSEMGLLEAEHKMNMDDLAQRVDSLEQSLKGENE